MSLSIEIRKRLPSFDLEVAFEAQGETVGILGASGSGKSMTLRCIAGLVRPDSGRIVVNGTTFFDSERGINLTPQQRKTALLFQRYQLFPTMTVAENIAVGIDRSVGPSERERMVAELLDFFHISGQRGSYPSRLSGGQQQRVALARMLAARPGILMLDEPFSALDEHLKASFEHELLDAFDRFHGTILYVSHDIDEALRFCDQIAVMDQGRLSDFGAAHRIVSHPNSLAALKLSGCKNISHARKISDHVLFAEDWAIELRSDERVPDDIAYVGMRATLIGPATEDTTVNVVDARAARVSDARFERTILLSLDGGLTPNGQRLYWRIDKLANPEVDGICRGDFVKVSLASGRLHLVRDTGRTRG